MSTAEMIFQLTACHKLLSAILCDTSIRLLKVVELHHVPLQIKFLSKLLFTIWLGASVRLFIVVHNFNVLFKGTRCTELLQTLATLILLHFLVHHLIVFVWMVLVAEVTRNDRFFGVH